jgi:hypothetical protein
MSAASARRHVCRCALQPWADYSLTGPSDNMVASFLHCNWLLLPVRRYAGLGDRTVDARWALSLASYFYHKTLTCRSAAGDLVCARLSVHFTPDHTSSQSTHHLSST